MAFSSSSESPTSRRPGSTSPLPPSLKVTEIVLALLIAANLCFLPWAFGSMEIWSQRLSLILAAVAFGWGLALNPQPFYLQKPVPRWKKLVTFPVFWIGLLLLGYVATQGLNPAWRYIEFGGMFWMVGIEHIEWLPTGADTPFEKFHAFRQLIVLGSAFLTLLTICLFANSARLLRLLLFILILNGFALACVGLAQILLHADKLLWTREPVGLSFLASFYYRNHGAAYFNLILAASIGFYLFSRERAWKAVTRRSADASPFFFFAAVTIFTLIIFSQSRAGVSIGAAIAISGFIYTFIHGFRWQRLRETTVLTSMYLALFALFTGTFVYLWGWDRVVERFGSLFDDEGNIQWGVRMKGYEATWAMFRDNPVWGWGAGSFDFFFPAYQAQIPEIAPSGSHRMIWQYAHNDPLQLLAEYGLVGSAFVVAIILLALVGIIRHGGLRRSIPLWCLIAGLATVAHSLVDFPFHNPAIAITAVALAAIAYRYSALERQRRAYDPRRSSASPGSSGDPEGDQSNAIG